MVARRWRLISLGRARPLARCAQVVSPGPGGWRAAAPRFCIPAAAVLPAEIVVRGRISGNVRAQCGPGYRKRRTRDTKCVRIADLQIMAFSLPVMFGCHTRHFAFSLPVMFISRSRSGTPAHWPDVLGRCPWGLADGVRPLPSAASQPCSSPRAEISVCGIILTHCGVVDIQFNLI